MLSTQNITILSALNSHTQLIHCKYRFYRKGNFLNVNKEIFRIIVVLYLKLKMFQLSNFLVIMLGFFFSPPCLSRNRLVNKREFTISSLIEIFVLQISKNLHLRNKCPQLKTIVLIKLYLK